MIKTLVAVSMFTLALAGAPTHADATPILITDKGIVLGVTGVDVDGVVYDVDFVEGSYNSLNQIAAPVFTTTDQGQAAAEALKAVLSLPDHAFVLDDPSAIFGIESTWAMIIVRLGQEVLGDAHHGTTVIVNQEGILSVGQSKFIDGTDTSTIATQVYTRWAVVPEPTTAILLGPGLLGLVAYRMRRHTS